MTTDQNVRWRRLRRAYDTLPMSPAAFVFMIGLGLVAAWHR